MFLLFINAPPPPLLRYANFDEACVLSRTICTDIDTVKLQEDLSLITLGKGLADGVSPQQMPNAESYQQT